MINAFSSINFKLTKLTNISLITFRGFFHFKMLSSSHVALRKPLLLKWRRSQNCCIGEADHFFDQLAGSQKYWNSNLGSCINSTWTSWSQKCQDLQKKIKRSLFILFAWLGDQLLQHLFACYTSSDEHLWTVIQMHILHRDNPNYFS